MAARASDARPPRVVKPAWWLLSEDVQLEGDIDDTIKPSKRPRKRAKAAPAISSEEQKALDAEKDVKEAVNHAVWYRACLERGHGSAFTPPHADDVIKLCVSPAIGSGR